MVKIVLHSRPNESKSQEVSLGNLVLTRFPADSGTHSSLSSRIGILNIWWCIIITTQLFKLGYIPFSYCIRVILTCRKSCVTLLQDLHESSEIQLDKELHYFHMFDQSDDTLKQWFSTGDNFPQYILQHFHYCEIELYL